MNPWLLFFLPALLSLSVLTAFGRAEEDRRVAIRDTDLLLARVRRKVRA